MVKRYLKVKPLNEVQVIVSRSFGCIPSIERVAIEQIKDA